ncbi:hypothetical protein GmRootV213_57530 (plasmid) [Variovorax sp. V213]|jgi:hypothetical protein|uniref:hypothetical protein n=1 Tax=Variovorax sp. V213 TaxID=3065955 RepID=UPI0034E8B481
MVTSSYWTRMCENCGHGRLVLQHDITNHRIYAHCEDCGMGWLRAADQADVGKGFLTLLGDFGSMDPTFDEIARSEWADHVCGSFDK